MNKQFTRDELVNVLRGWHKMFKHFGRDYDRNVQALGKAADMLEEDGKTKEEAE